MYIVDVQPAGITIKSVYGSLLALGRFWTRQAMEVRDSMLYSRPNVSVACLGTYVNRAIFQLLRSECGVIASGFKFSKQSVQPL